METRCATFQPGNQGTWARWPLALGTLECNAPPARKNDCGRQQTASVAKQPRNIDFQRSNASHLNLTGGAVLVHSAGIHHLSRSVSLRLSVTNVLRLTKALAAYIYLVDASAITAGF